MLDPKALDQAVDALEPALRELAGRIHAHPELAFEEHRAAGWIAEAVEREGIRVERGVGGLETALRAETGTGSAPRVAILAEYDALPEIGHACGHDLIAAGAVGAFLALARCAPRLRGSVVLLGTPAEEHGGGKIRLVDAGVFEKVDAALMFHPFDRDLLAHPALASVWFTMRFHGRPAHVAAAPWEGRSALTACMETFRLIDSQRIHFRDGVRVHGFITDGGQAVNIIPERAVSEFSCRAPDLTELARVREIVERCARGAALACGVDVELTVQEGYRDMRNNMTLARAFGRQLEQLGRTAREGDSTVGAASTDMGNVSQVVPSIHPWLAVCDAGETMCHDRRFERAAASERGLQTMLVAAKALARTAAQALDDPETLREARREFDAAS